MHSIESLISPVSREEFDQEYFEKKHLRIEADSPERFLPLISFRKLDEILGFYGMSSPDINVVSRDRAISEAEYTWKKHMIDPAKVSRFFSEGATIIFNSLQDRVEPLHDLCADLSAQLGLRTQANIYLTPPTSQGFASHWDTHDVFVLQVEGEKQWQIYEETLPLPIENEKFKFQKGDFEPENVADEFTLKPGEVLYIPRGVMHSAVSSSQKSLHITLGIIPYTWADMFRDYIEMVSESDVALRESVPLGSDDVENICEELRGKAQIIIDTDSVNRIVESQKNKSIRSYRPRKCDFLQQAFSASEIYESDVVRPYPHIIASLEETEDAERIVLNAGDRAVYFPVAAKRTLELVFGHGQGVPVGEFEDEVTWESRKVVVSSLIKEGLAFKASQEWRGDHEG